MGILQLFEKILHYGTLPGAMGLVCVLFFMAGRRSHGILLMRSLSAAVSTNLLLKALFRVPRPWMAHIETAPAYAEGGYAFPCLHTQIVAAVLCAVAFTSKRKPVRFGCAFLIWLTAVVRVLSGLQSVADVLTGAAVGCLLALVLCRFSKSQLSNLINILILLSGLAAAVLLGDGWGLGLNLTALVLELLDKPFRKAEAHRTRFGKLYGSLLSMGLYIGFIVFLPFLIEWLITPLWPGQTLIIFLITFIPCLPRLFSIF